MNPLRFLLTFVFSLCLIACALAAEETKQAKPNVIVILADDMGWADLEAQGVMKDVKTPHLDALAAGGVRCTAGYVTSPQCTPSRAAIITGCFQQRYGIDTIPDDPLTPKATTLAERLGPVGYRCGFVGKWHLEPNVICVEWLKREMPELVALPRAERRIPPEKHLPYSPSAQGFHDYFWGEMKHYRANYSLDGSPVKPEGKLISMPNDFRLEVQTRAAVTFIENHHDQPFYLHLAYYGPHTPMEATKKYLDRFPGPMPERRRYALAMIAAIDDGVGEIMEKLRKLGLEKNTLVIFTSDNGAPLHMTKPDSPIGGDTADAGWDGSLNDPWVGEKAMLTEGGIRVPMIYSWNGTLPAGKIYDKPVSSLDIAATANELAGLAPTSSLDGVNLMPFLTGKNPAAPHERLCWRFWSQAAIREGRWKYISVGGNSEFLFDVESHDGETKNLITANPERAADLRTKLGEWSNQFEPKGIPSEARNKSEDELYKFYSLKP